MKSEKKKTRTEYAVKNVIFNSIYQVVNTIVNIIVPPLIISRYGSVINGLRSMIKQIISYVQLVGAGISESTIVSLYNPLAENDTKKISGIYNATNKAFNYSGIVCSIISLLVAIIYPFFIEENLNYWFVAGMICVLALSGASEFFVVGKCRALLTADQKVYVVNIAQILGAIASTLATIIGIKLRLNIIMIELLASITYIMRILVVIIYVKKRYNFLDKSIKPENLATSKRKDATVHQLATLVIFGSQSIIIAKFCGLAEVSVYSVYNLIFNGINTLLATVSSAILASFGNILAVESKEKLKKTYNVYEYFYYILLFTFYTVAYIMIMPFIKLYTYGVVDINYVRNNLVLLFSITGLLNCLRTPGGTLINASGHYKETKNRALIEMSICIIGQLIFVQKLGLVGILIGTLLAYLYRTIDVIVYSHSKILNQSIGKTVIRISSNGLIMLGSIYMFNRVVHVLTIESYIEWIIVAASITLVAGILFTTINYIMDRNTFRETKKYILSLLKKG